MKAKYFLVGAAALLILGVLTDSGHAAIDRKSAVGIWLFDEGGGGIARDSSGNGNDGMLLPADGGPQWTGRSQFGGALEFDGSGVYIEFPTGENLKTPHFTFMAWFNTRKLNGYGHIWQTGTDWNDMAGYVVRVHQDGTAQAGLSFGPANTASWATGPGLEADRWYHIALTFDGTTATLYLDGVSVATAAGQGSIMYDDQPVRIGVHSQDTGGAFDGFIDDVALFDTALEADDILTIMDQGLAEIVGGPPIASAPEPANGQTDVPREPALGWTAGQFAATHDVYFGMTFDDVNAASRVNPMGVLLSQGQAEVSYSPPGVLDFSQTYYWRVDEVNAAPDNTIFKGDVWHFTVEPFAYPIQGVLATSNAVSDDGSGPENTVNGSGLNANDQHSIVATDMWLTAPGQEGVSIQYEFDRVYKLDEMLVWNYNVQFELVLGFGLKDVTIEYSENGTDWTALGDVEFARATAKATYTANTTVDFGGVPARYVRLNVNSGYGFLGQFGLSEVRFMYIPAHPREPQPADGAAGVNPDTTLSWRPGRDATSHEIYLGTEPNDLLLTATSNEASYTPGDLEFGRTYYWQIVEANEAGEALAWAGDVWSFSTQQDALIDGFETYNDDIDAGTTIFDTWLDGWVNDNGSTVGYFDAPFAEQTIVRTGKQSMPLGYDNMVAPFYSETERIFETPQNWTGNGADALVLYVRGNAPAFAEAADGRIIMSAIGTDIWDVSDQFRYAYKSLSGNGSMVVRVDSIVRSNEWAKAGVMIRETLEASSAHAFVAVTPESSHGISFQRRPIAGQASANTDVANIPMPHWVKLTRTGNVFTAQHSADGVTWVDITPTAPVTISMAANVYIGLAVTSHTSLISTAAEFANVSTTGNVTGTWQTADIGVTQPEGNSAQPMYVRIEDSTGKAATAVNADLAITQRPSWQEWAIPYSDLSGVNLSRVEKMVIGVGSKISPTAGGTGIVYVDDIAYGRSATE